MDEEVTSVFSNQITLTATAPACTMPASRPASHPAVPGLWATAVGVTGPASAYVAQVDAKTIVGVAGETRRTRIEKHVPGIPPRSRPV
jgi:hypothetical protein